MWDTVLLFSGKLIQLVLPSYREKKKKDLSIESHGLIRLIMVED